MKRNFPTNIITAVRYALCVLVFSIAPGNTVHAQEFKWMSVGSLHNWFSSMGCEEEEGFVLEQQYGLQWPALYKHQDAQAAKAFWIGLKDHKYADGTTGPYVVHIGPRVHGLKEFFPVKFVLLSKYDPPQIIVDNKPSEAKSVDVDDTDPTIPSDRMLVNVVNTAAGITMTRKIMQFSQPYHDNYMVFDYVFKNTGNRTNKDTNLVLPGETLQGVYFYFQYRYAPCADTRYVIGQNPTGWGINTMNDVRGDGQTPATPFFVDPIGNGINYNVRASYSWHGKYPPFTLYDNIGGPIWNPYYDKTDTVGRLGAPQFIGIVTLHADKSATDTTDDSTQPSTTSYEGSDEPPTSGNDHLNPAKNTADYTWITRGNNKQRHADKVGPTGDPALGTPGGYSNAIGYGPYTLAPGQSVHIVQAEAAAGLGREACVEIGKQFKVNNGNTATLISYKGVSKTKTDWVYTGRDSLFLAFNRAIANYSSNYAIAQPPLPPKNFTVTSGGDRIILSWSVYGTGPAATGFEIYRALGRSDSTYYLLSSPGAGDRSYIDATPIRGLSYYYYIVAVGNPADNNGKGNTPAGALRSNRYSTQTYDPASLKRPATKDMDSIRVVPNPYNISASTTRLLFSEPDKIGFLNIPGECTIKIYSELGELIYKIDHNDGSGDAYWDSITSSSQVVVSGVYIAVIETPQGKRAMRKFVIIR